MRGSVVISNARRTAARRGLSPSGFAWLLSFASCAGHEARSVAGHPPPAPEQRPAPPPRADAPPHDDGQLPRFVVDGKPFCFVGANNYYLTYKPRPMVDSLLEGARAAGLGLIRIWGFIDAGVAPGPSARVPGAKDGVFFQYWNTNKKRPERHDGANGLERLDYVIFRAKSLGLKLIVVLVNGQPDFGGMAQYRAWYGLRDESAFYTDERVKRAYRTWTESLLKRASTIDGVPYAEDPTIFAWELANEPRCVTSEGTATRGCDPRVITAWASEMSAYVKSLAPRHMVSVGDEGFFAGSPGQFAYDGHVGVDHAALLALDTVDFGTFHLFPDNWNLETSFGEQWITDHLKAARAAGKPTILEEYGTIVNRDAAGAITWGAERRATTYGAWNELVIRGGGSAAMAWLLVDKDERGVRYPDYDNYSIYAGAEAHELLWPAAKEFATGARACREASPSDGSNPSPFARAVRVATPPDSVP